MKTGQDEETIRENVKETSVYFNHVLQEILTL